MPSFFPTPYPDELLYSMIARYHVRSGNTSPKATLQDLFNSRTATAVVDMPCNIDILTGRLPLFIKLESESVILNYTLFPYYTAFLPQDRVNMVMKSMKGNFGSDIHNRTGIMASNIWVPEYLRFCPECIKSDAIKYGEYYWHRTHQAPGVIICPTHKALLKDSNVRAHGLNKHEFIAADECRCLNNPRLVSYSDKDFDKLWLLTKDIEWLIENYRIVRDSEDSDKGFREKYLSYLIDKGFATSKGRVYQNEFIESFRAFYGNNFLELIQCGIEEDFENNWLSSIVRKHRKSFHPLRHLLVMRYLKGSIEGFFGAKHKYMPFGEGPWPCLNAAAEHYGKLVVNNLAVTHCFDTKLPVGTFKCSCGFIYSRGGPDKTQDDLYKIGRIKQFGAVWEGRLRELIEKEKLGIRETARKLRVDANTVKRHAELLGLDATWLQHKTAPTEKGKKAFLSPCNEMTEQYRVRWQKLKDSHPEALKTELREMDKATYVWLYRHDRDWLDMNSPAKVRIDKQYSRVDWASRDKDTLIRVVQAVNDILDSDSKPERITLGRIGKKIGLLALLEKHIDKMPKTKAFLEKSIESTEQYTVRRVRWCISELNKKGGEVKEWKVIRMAGLHPGYSMQIQKIIDVEISRCTVSAFWN